jgi:hypothetical protein
MVLTLCQLIKKCLVVDKFGGNLLGFVRMSVEVSIRDNPFSHFYPAIEWVVLPQFTTLSSVVIV